MARGFVIDVQRQGNKLVCVPPETIVKAGDTVVWSPDSVVAVFHGHTPFLEGRGPFSRGKTATVGGMPPLEDKQRFTPQLSLDGATLPTTGDIIFEGG
jgi:hypothetical protein